MNTNKLLKPSVILSLLISTQALQPAHALLIETSTSAESNAAVNAQISADANSGVSVDSTSFVTLTNDIGNDPGAALASSGSTVTGDLQATAQVAGLDVNAEAKASQSFDITNDTGLMQDVTFDFTVHQGKLDIFADIIAEIEGAGLFTGSSSIEAGLNAQILLDSVVLWSSDVALSYSQSGYSTNLAGINLNTETGGSLSTGLFGWGEYNHSLDLGQFNNNQQKLLEYEVSTYADINLDLDCTLVEVDAGLGGGLATQTTTANTLVEGQLDIAAGLSMPPCLSNLPNALALFGDPVNFTTPVTVSFSSAPTPVNEPIGIAILLSLLLLAHRKQNKTA
ncbi:hypothetical protein [Gayadomonas joobiniege]|uniref:hypothetical protein n=1 Tax=Gayadomonas joobiniege TaxID=1234606 RepID=UPI0003653257|nr:hypothetical protein [Gayadomonas joobiniege]